MILGESILPDHPVNMKEGSLKTFIKTTVNHPSTMKDIPATPKLYQQPILPRMILEVNTKDNVYVAANTPSFIVNDKLREEDLVSHVMTRASSANFLGFIMACVVECEDMVINLHIFPHVFKNRVFIYKPKSILLLELCSILSMIENLENPTGRGLDAVLRRAHCIFSKCKESMDARFLMNGIETLIATSLAYHNLNTDDCEPRVSPLVAYRLFRCLEDSNGESRGLLKSIFFNSHKMETPDVSPNKGDGDKRVFNIFYCDTIFTRHLRVPNVVRFFKCACFHSTVLTQILK
ncbi:unknown [Bovine gammaherpesvirus 4]|uniref:Cytoplasmic envelopment protein 1 n=2 Tax=Bovine herpesvirus 4 TaxID=10385 RepID=A0A858PWP7_BHV4|nr:unknown [Bovine gammaherpesvirus 4]AAK07961.1 unknown [Bovine gammaherpesvirus 4]QJC19114.1 hypothetical protein [Bovine gammaherpesvirus 4]